MARTFLTKIETQSGKPGCVFVLSQPGQANKSFENKWEKAFLFDNYGVTLGWRVGMVNRIP